MKQPYRRLHHHPPPLHRRPNHPGRPLLHCRSSCQHNHCHILHQRRSLIPRLESPHLSVHQMIFPGEESSERTISGGSTNDRIPLRPPRLTLQDLI